MSDEDELQFQTREELEAHYGPAGPVVAGRAFIEAITADGERAIGDLGAFRDAWALLDDNHRLCRAQAWLWNNREAADIAGHDLEELAAALMPTDTSHPLWHAFAFTELNQILEVWGDYDLDKLGAVSRPRPIGPDLEIVIFLENDEPMVMTEMTLVQPFAVFIMRSTSDGWRVAAYQDRLPIPGWPPDFSPDPSGGDR